MSDLFARVAAGQKIDIEADLWNAITRTARDRQVGVPGVADADPALAFGHNVQLVTVRNDTGRMVPPYHALALGEPVGIDPDENPHDFRRRPTFTADYFRGGRGPVVLTAEAILPGKFGRAVVRGVTVARVSVGNAGHGFAFPLPVVAAFSGSSTMPPLISGGHGLFRLLDNPGTGTHDCAVAFGELPAVAWVKVTDAPSADGRFYVGRVDALDLETNAWVTAPTAVLVRPSYTRPNGDTAGSGMLTVGQRYLCTYEGPANADDVAGSYPASLDVYVPTPDANQTHATGVGGATADEYRGGYVSVGGQVFRGPKTFRNHVHVGYAESSPATVDDKTEPSHLDGVLLHAWEGVGVARVMEPTDNTYTVMTPRRVFCSGVVGSSGPYTEMLAGLGDGTAAIVTASSDAGSRCIAVGSYASALVGTTPAVGEDGLPAGFVTVTSASAASSIFCVAGNNATSFCNTDFTLCDASQIPGTDPELVGGETAFAVMRSKSGVGPFRYRGIDADLDFVTSFAVAFDGDEVTITPTVAKCQFRGGLLVAAEVGLGTAVTGGSKIGGGE